MVHRVSKARDLDGDILKGHYVYRGFDFRIYGQAGYWNRYRLQAGREHFFTTQAEVKKYIDNKVDGNA